MLFVLVVELSVEQILRQNKFNTKSLCFQIDNTIVILIDSFDWSQVPKVIFFIRNSFVFFISQLNPIIDSQKSN